MSSTSEAANSQFTDECSIIMDVNWNLIFHNCELFTYLSGVNELISQTLSNCFDVTECSFASASAQQPDGLVDASQR